MFLVEAKLSLVYELFAGVPSMEVTDGSSYVAGNRPKALSRDLSVESLPRQHSNSSCPDFDSYWRVEKRGQDKLDETLARAAQLREMPDVPGTPEIPVAPVPETPLNAVAYPQDLETAVEEQPKGGLVDPPPPEAPAKKACEAPLLPTEKPAKAASVREDGDESDGVPFGSSPNEVPKELETVDAFDKYYYRNIGCIRMYYFWSFFNAFW